MSDREQLLVDGLRYIRMECERKDAEPEGLLRKIHQLVGVVFQRANVPNAGDIAEPVEVAEQAGKRYLLDLGSVQVTGQLDDAARLQGNVWLNDATVDCEGLEVSLAFGKPARVNILGVVPYAGREAEASDHAGQPSGER